MAIAYKIDILACLKQAGYNTNRLRKDRILGESTIQKLRQKELVSWNNINTICELLNCQPGDILEYAEESESLKRD